MKFSALAAGDVPLVIMLHGFPDTPHTFVHQIGYLAGRGYRVVAPYLRGYETKSIPADGDFKIETILEDIGAFAEDLGAETFHLVGHDWGAIIAYGFVRRHPERLRSLTTMAIPPADKFWSAALRKAPVQLWLSRYIQLFQVRGFSERTASRNDFAYIRQLWRRWSPGLTLTDDLWKPVRTALQSEGVLNAALEYYRQNANPLVLSGMKSSVLTEGSEFRVPTMIINGAEDGCMHKAMFEHSVDEALFPEGLRQITLSRSGHFMHLEQVDDVNAALSGWLNSHRD